MGSSAINYDALAQQHGATVDYDALAAQHGATAPKQDAPTPEGFWHSLGAQFGLTPEAAQAVAQDTKDHPIKNLLWNALGPAGVAAKGLYDQAKQSGGEISQAVQAGKQGNAAGVVQHAVTAIPIVGPALSKGADQYADKNYAGEAGTLLGASAQAAPLVAGAIERTPAGPPLQRAGQAVEAAPGQAATTVGQAAQDAGTGLINKTVGTLKSDFKRGANPARGYLATGNGPSISMQSLADKGSAALEDVGTQLGAAYKTADATGLKIPVDTVAQEMAKPIQKAIDLETGPGGTGNLGAIQSYVQQFGPAFEKAAQNGGFTPSELFKMKRDIAQNTNWSDPTQFSLKSVRQQQAGALSGILSDAIPETADLNQMYQDLTKFTDRATERANTGSRPLTAHIYKAGMAATGALAGGMEGNALAGAAAGALLDSVPVKTTIASGLYRGGKALSSLGERLTPANGTPMVAVPGNNLARYSTDTKTSNPQDAATILRNRIKGRLKPSTD
jgi:hypothetical protein